MEFYLDQKVRLLNETKERRGTIKGVGTLFNRLVYLVVLEEGFWSEDKSTFVSTLILDPSKLAA